jgi:hypothetical protein
MKPYVEAGYSKLTLEEYLKEDTTRRQYLKPFGASARGRPRLLQSEENTLLPILTFICIIFKIDILFVYKKKKNKRKEGVCWLVPGARREIQRPWIEGTGEGSLNPSQLQNARKSALKLRRENGQLTRRAVSAQATSNMRTMCTPRQLARWHRALEAMRNAMRRKNK